MTTRLNKKRKANDSKLPVGKVMMTFIRRDEISSSTMDVFYLPEEVFDQSPFSSLQKSGNATLVLDLTRDGKSKEALCENKTHLELEKASSELRQHREAKSAYLIMDDGELILEEVAGKKQEKTPLEKSDSLLVGGKIFYLRVIS
jgi:hypothetical protein